MNGAHRADAAQMGIYSPVIRPIIKCPVWGFFYCKRLCCLYTGAKGLEMPYMQNTEYITINTNGIFIGGKPATTYRGATIGYPESIHKNFQNLQNHYPNIQEMHFLTSKTTGEFYKTGNPVAEKGNNLWACVAFNDGYVAPWVLVSINCTHDFYISHEISGNLYRMIENYTFLHDLLGRYQDVTIRLNLQNMAGRSFELNGFRLTVEKIAQKTK